MPYRALEMSWSAVDAGRREAGILVRPDPVRVSGLDAEGLLHGDML
jgi:hypothetical protein